MPYVMKPETWMNLTEVRFKVRSSQLRRVDKCLAQYDKTKSPADLEKLKVALHQWKMSKGYDAVGGKPKWMTSERNSRQAVETLDKQIFGLPETVNQEVLNDLAELPFYGIEAWAEERGRRAMKQAREQALAEMFAGKKVVVGKAGMAWAFDKMKRNLSSAKSSAGQVSSAAAAPITQPIIEQARQAAMGMIEQVLGEYPIEVAQEVIAAVTAEIPSFLAELAASVAPYLSLVKSGGQTFYNAAQAIRAEYQYVVSEDHLESFAKGDPYAAVTAVRRMIERKRNQYTRLTAIYGTDTAIRAGGVIVDAAAHGAPVGSALLGALAAFGKSIALLGLELFLVGRDFYEKFKVNKVLADGSGAKIGKVMFDTCPLLGCYFVAGSTTSNIINFCVDDVGATGWKLDIEVMVKQHVTPMIGYARDAISAARLQVEGMERSKAAVNDTSPGILNAKNRLQKAIVTKVSAALPFVEDPNDYQQVAKKQGYTAVSPAVLKGRIQGQGPRR